MKCARAAKKAHLEDELKKKKAALAEKTAEEKKNTVGKGKLATARAAIKSSTGIRFSLPINDYPYNMQIW